MKVPVAQPKWSMADKLEDAALHVAEPDLVANRPSVAQFFKSPQAKTFWSDALPRVFGGPDALIAATQNLKVSDGSKVGKVSMEGAYAKVGEALGDNFTLNKREINLLAGFLTFAAPTIALKGTPQDKAAFTAFAKSVEQAFADVPAVAQAVKTVNDAIQGQTFQPRK